jgi:hypothetical protein
VSTPSPWSQPPRPTQDEQPYGPPSAPAPQQGYAPQPDFYAPQPSHAGQQAVTQPLPYGQPVPAGQYAGPPPLPYAPKPEKRLMPGVWWALVLNLVATFLVGLLLLLLGWFLVELVAGFSSEEVSWSEALGSDTAGPVVLVVAGFLLVSLLVSWGLTVAALALWRLMRAFRTIPSFVQALVAFVSMWVFTTVLSFVLQLVFGGFSAISGTTTTF